MRLRISVAMATYNGAAFVERQLESFAEQERIPDELVVCDDASTDRTLEIVCAFARRAPFEVRVTRNERNLGLNRNFECALASCTGDVIFISDQDDFWFPTKVGTVERVFTQRPEIQVVANDQIIADENLRPTKFTKLGQLRALGRSDDSLITGCCTTMRREWRDVCLPFPESITAYDNWIGAITTACGVRHVIPRPLQLYRRHANNASHALASRAARISALDLLKDQNAESASQGLVAEADRIDIYIDHLSTVTRRDHVPLANVVSGITRLTRKREKVIQREKVLAQPMPARVIEVAKFLLAGGYGEFSGLRSAIADLIR